jgi:hypothetical protein
LTSRDAETIATKLNAEFKSKAKSHDIAIVRINGKEVGRFGIRRGSGEPGHDHIPRQMHMSMKHAIQMAQCKIYRAEYENLLRLNGHYPAAESPKI